MTSPAPRRVAVRSSTADRKRTLARKWTYLLSLSSYLALPQAEMEQELLELVNRVLDAMTSEPLPVDRVAEIGARLVELHGVGKSSLRCTVDVLAGALLSDPDLQRLDRLSERVAHLLGALAAGYVDAIRASTMEQQDSLHRALLEFTWESEQKLRASEARLDAVLEASANGIAITDLHGRFVRVNAAFDRILGSSDETTRTTLFDLVPRGAYRELLDGKLESVALRPEPLSGTPVALTASLVRDDDGKASGVVTVIADETELSRLNHQVGHDGVTGLPNREHFTARLEQLHRDGAPITLYELELDGFALLCNGLGPDAGDSLLRAVGERLRDVLADAGDVLVARLEGATFAILVAGSPTTPDTGVMIKKLQHALTEPVRVAGVRMPTSASIGVVHQHSPQADPADLVAAAGLALRRARRKGCGQWALYDPERDDRDRENLALAATMADAWDSGQLRVVYRPLVRLADNKVLGLAASMVWHHPKHGPIPHLRCQELAERTGLIRTIGTWLLRRACLQVRRQRELPLHLNLTCSQASDRDLVIKVRQALEESGLPPGRLRVGMPMSELRAGHGSVDNLKALAATGVMAAVHQFAGTPEDLADLADLDIRVAHLSPSLIRYQAQHPTPLMATAVTDLITLLHRTPATAVVVDDLKTRPQATWWRQAGADAATGPLFAASAI
jgi:diguanylate cyclase (GGDEF)-like protein